MRIQNLRPNALVLFAFPVYALLHLLPIFRFGDAAFGYDFGIYRRIAAEYFARIFDPSQPAFAFAAFSNSLLALGASLDHVLIVWYLFIAVGVWFLFYITVKEYAGKKTAIMAAALLAFSLVQFEFYSWYYYRQLLAIFFLLGSLYLLRKRSSLALLPLIVVGSIHPPTFIPLGLALAVTGLFKKEERRFLWSIAGASLAGTLLLNFQEFRAYLPLLSDRFGLLGNVPSYRASELTGQFIDVETFARMSILYAPVGLVGIFLYWRKQPLFTSLFILSAVLFFAGVLLYRRYLVLIDLWLIIFAAMAFVSLWERVRAHWSGRFSAGLFAFLLFGYAVNFTIGKSPLISPEEIVRIREMGEMTPAGSYIMALSSQDAPWVYGFTKHPVIAPGMFEWNRWTEAEWGRFWTTSLPAERAGLLRSYETPIYIYVSPKTLGIAERWKDDLSFTRLNSFLWSYSPASLE